MKVIKRNRGRPWVYDAETVRSIAASIAEGASKKQACAKAGVAYSSFMRWQRQNRGLKRLIEQAERMCRDNQRMERELEALLSEKPVELNVRSRLHNRRRYLDPEAQPVKWMKLIQWWLLHRVRIDVVITPEIEAAACRRFKIPWGNWEEAKQRFPSLLPKVNQKRLRRMEYALETGMIPPNGWTPPDPKKRSTQNVAPYAQFWKH
jgi:transposase